MKTVRITIGTSEFSATVPERWDELTASQFCRVLSFKPAYLPVVAMRYLLDLPDDEAQFVMPVQWHALYRSVFRYLTNPRGISVWILDAITLSDGRSVYPPAADFDNVTWEEFLFADELAAKQRWEAVAACLFRPMLSVPDENADTRTPFTRAGMNNRYPLFAELDAATLRAVEVNYLALRRRLTKRYSYLFTSSGSEQSDPGWIEVSHALLGDTVWNEQQLLHTSVGQVLYRLDRQIKDSRKRKN